METAKKESSISITNIVIGAGLLWILIYVISPLIQSKALSGTNLLIGDQYIKSLMVLFFSVAIMSLIVGMVSGLIIKNKPFVHGVYIGIFAQIMCFLTSVPTKSFSNYQVVLGWILAVLVTVLIGTLCGIGIKKLIKS